jgi:hypothetical protein
MQQQMDDFTILLPHSIDFGTCDLKVYSNLDRLWRLVKRYTMASPLRITVVDNKAEHVRAICANHHEVNGWQLKDEPSAVAPALAGDLEFPLAIRVQDAKGNILKMKLQVRNNKAENSRCGTTTAGC